MQLNPRQAEAVEIVRHPLILAGPGSGKTRVITEKVVHLLESGVNPAAILALTFSEKAAQEMADRIARQAAGVISNSSRLVRLAQTAASRSASSRGRRVHDHDR